MRVSIRVPAPKIRSIDAATLAGGAHCAVTVELKIAVGHSDKTIDVMSRTPLEMKVERPRSRTFPGSELITDSQSEHFAFAEP